METKGLNQPVTVETNPLGNSKLIRRLQGTEPGGGGKGVSEELWAFTESIQLKGR